MSSTAISQTTFSRDLPVLMLPYVVVGQSEGLREQKKRQARLALEQAALRLFQERGYEATTIKEIADSAGMSPRTFFRYFASKEDVVFSRPAEQLAILRGILEAQPDDENHFLTLRNAATEFAEYLQNQPAEDIKLRATLLAGSPELRRRGGEELQTWGDELARHIAEREGTQVLPRHQLLASVTLQVLVVAGTAWGGDLGNSYTECLQEMYDELQGAVDKISEAAGS
jgi:AcrR family transcriptional regulator